MTINQHRLFTNSLYTGGQQKINGEYVADILEHTPSMIPSGIYKATLLNIKGLRHRQIAIVADDYNPSDPNPFVFATIISGNSYRSAHGKSDIVLGKQQFPGTVILSSKIYERIFERIEKCVARGETIQLYITDHMMKQTDVPKFWLEDPKHGCPDTTIHCEANTHGDVLVYDGEELIKVHTLEEQKARYLSSTLNS